MITKYKVNIPGPYHIKNNIPCQDACCIRESEDGVVFATVADGLGSERFSDIGAKIASGFVASFCRKYFRKDMPKHEVISMLKQAYTRAYLEVQKRAASDGNDVDQYDCTLCTAIYDGQNLYFGQSGDSGMIVADNNGSYYKITEQQRDDEGYVYPLCFGPEYWEFGRVEGNVVSVMLMTDGVWDQVCPKLLKNAKQQINVGFADMFMNHYGLDFSSIKRLEKEAANYFENFPEERLDDDKTVVVLINSNASPSRREDDYYDNPDWNLLIREREERLKLIAKTRKVSKHIDIQV